MRTGEAAYPAVSSMGNEKQMPAVHASQKLLRTLWVQCVEMIQPIVVL